MALSTLYILNDFRYNKNNIKENSMNKIEKDILALIAEDSRLTAKKMAAMLGIEESKVMQTVSGGDYCQVYRDTQHRQRRRRVG